MTEITESMIRRGMRELEGYVGWIEPMSGATHDAVRDILTAALAHDGTEAKEKQTMQEESEVNGVPLSITDGILRIGTKQRGWLFDRKTAPDLIAFIQQWLDHDPEQELRQKIIKLRIATMYNEPDKIIAAVREHDRKYGSNQ